MRLSFFIALFLCVALAVAGPIKVYFAPDGGFSEKNKKMTVTFPTGEKVRATLTNGLRDMIMRTEDGGQIKICMYAMGDLSVIDELIEAAGERNIKVKLILDACADWTVDIRSQILDKIKKAQKAYKKKGVELDFQMKYITQKAMVDRGRTRVLKLEEGEKTIYGTMHEKFGIFYTKSSKIPYDSFAGSSNVSYGSDQIFAENRIFFHDRPAVARQFQEEFARLWNEYGECATGNCASEMYVAAYPVAGDVRVIFNGEPITEDKYYRIDEEIEDIIERVRWNGSVDVAMFAFTHRGLADKLITYAERNKKAKFRILMDQTQMANTETHRGVMGPWFEEQVKKKGLTNFEVRYKFRANAYGVDPEEEVPKGKKPSVHLIHWRNLLLHHKLVIVNREILCSGSYNWSSSAEFRNLENVMIFEKKYKGQDNVVERFLYEYDEIWDSLKKKGAVKKPVRGPQTVTGPQGRALQEKIIKTLSYDDNLLVRDTIEAKKDISFNDLLKEVKLSKKKLNTSLDYLIKSSLVCLHVVNGKKVYSLAD